MTRPERTPTAADVAASRAAQGLPPTVVDPDALKAVAKALRPGITRRKAVA